MGQDGHNIPLLAEKLLACDSFWKRENQEKGESVFLNDVTPGMLTTCQISWAT